MAKFHWSLGQRHAPNLSETHAFASGSLLEQANHGRLCADALRAVESEFSLAEADVDLDEGRAEACLRGEDAREEDKHHLAIGVRGVHAQ